MVLYSLNELNYKTKEHIMKYKIIRKIVQMKKLKMLKGWCGPGTCIG